MRKYVCQQGCNEGFEFKTPQSKNCEPVQVNNTTFDNETTISDRSSLIPTTHEGTNNTSSPPTRTTTKPHEEEDAGVSSGKEVGIVIAAVFVCFPIVVIYLAIGCCCYYINVKRTCGFKGNTRRKYQAKFRREGNSSSQSNVQLQQEPLMSSPDVTDPILQVSAVKYVFCWPCNLPCFKEAPKIDHTNLPDNKEVRVMVGKQLKLVIGISGSPTPIVTWWKDGKRIERIVKLQAQISNDDHVAELKIPKTEQSDTGKYQIKVENEIGSDTAVISVIVLEAPKMDLTNLPDNKEVHVMVGKQLKLVIGISGSPTPTVTWLKDGKRIERAEKSNDDHVAELKIPKTEQSDTGKYQIEVENEIGSDTAVISVIVLEAPKMDLTNLPDNKEVHVMVGKQLKLVIGISGSPTPNVTWLKDGKHIERATKSINDGVAKLEIQKAERSDTGKYQIKLANVIGSDTVDISVIVL
ncbi:hemicentin-2-like, partial [Ruditapes philippinarum]|uniref:hemicentin-2-like n=1 Tax=Ruditapes philippinarum TaxID=129788 RepID=UPI00295BC886